MIKKVMNNLHHGLTMINLMQPYSPIYNHNKSRMDFLLEDYLTEY